GPEGAPVLQALNLGPAGLLSSFGRPFSWPSVAAAVRWRAGGSAGCSSGCLGGSLRLRPLLREKEAAQEVGKAPGAPGQPVIALRRRPRGLGAGGLGKEKGEEGAGAGPARLRGDGHLAPFE